MALEDWSEVDIDVGYLVCIPDSGLSGTIEHVVRDECGTPIALGVKCDEGPRCWLDLTVLTLAENWLN